MTTLINAIFVLWSGKSAKCQQIMQYAEGLKTAGVQFINIDSKAVRQILKTSKKYKLKTVPAILISRPNNVIQIYEGQSVYNILKELLAALQDEKQQDNKVPQHSDINNLLQENDDDQRRTIVNEVGTHFKPNSHRPEKSVASASIFQPNKRAPRVKQIDDEEEQDEENDDFISNSHVLKLPSKSRQNGENITANDAAKLLKERDNHMKQLEKQQNFPSSSTIEQEFDNENGLYDDDL